MKNILYSLICLLALTGCGSVLHSIAHGGKNLGQAFIDPRGYDEKIKQEYIEQECPKSFHQFKKEYFKESTSLAENIYQTLQNSSYDSFITRLKTEGGETDDNGIKVILKNNISKSNPMLLALMYNDVNSYVNNIKQFVEGIEKRKNYRATYVGENKPSFDLGEWPKDAEICNSFFDQEEYKELVKNYKLVSDLAYNIYNYAYDLEEKDFHKKTGVYIGGTNNLLVPYMVGAESEPMPNYVYYLNGLQVFQNIPGGILVGLRSDLSYSNKLIFVSTNRNFVDSQTLDNIPVILTGTKSYSTVLGANKTIYAFKIIDTTPYKQIVKNYYFYPTLRELDENNAKQAADYLQKLFTIKKNSK